MTLHEYQERAVQHIATHAHSVLSIDMGLGKTAAVLSFIERTQPASVIIVAPKRVRDSVWKQEAEKWGYSNTAAKMVIVNGTKVQRHLKLQDSDHPYKIVSRDNLTECVGMGCSLLVLDELTSFKNTTSKRWKAVKLIQAERVVGLTGTFLANGAIDIFGQATACGLMSGYNFYAWRASYFRDKLAGSGLQFQKWVLRVPLTEVLKPIEENIFTLTAADYLNIPPVTETTHPVALNDTTRQAYNDLDAFLNFQLVDDGERLAVQEGAKFAKLQTLCNGFVYDKNGNAIRGEVSDKLQAVAEFIDDCHNAGESVLCFYAFREEAAWLTELLREKGIKVANVKDSYSIVKWNDGELDVLLAHPASAGHGLNLQAGGRILVWSSLTYNYEYFAQANARLARQGQTRQVQIHYFVAENTCEAQVVKALQRKEREQTEFTERTKQ